MKEPVSIQYVYPIPFTMIPPNVITHTDDPSPVGNSQNDALFFTVVTRQFHLDHA